MDPETKTAAQYVAELKVKHEGYEAKARELEKIVTELKVSSADAEELKTAKADLAKATAAIEQFKTDFETYKLEGKDGDEPTNTLCEAIEAAMKSDGFQSGKTIEVKASTVDVITPIISSQVIPGVNMPRQRTLAFMPRFNVNTVAQDKDTIVWVEGEYASHVGYVSEGVGQVTEDTVHAEEKSRKLAKISAKIKVTAEMYEDKSYVAQMLEREMYSKAMLWLDKELYAGAGADENGKTNKIYGLKTHATAFSAAKAGVAAKIASPTLADLMGAVKLQGSVLDGSTQNDKGGFNLDLVFINPIDAMTWRHEKAKDGQYLLRQLSDGSQVMGGLIAIESTAIAANTIMAMESGLAELWLKRNFEIKTGQEGTDLTDDIHTIVLFMRAQSLVKDINKEGIIYVSDITAALSAITKPVA